MWGRFLNVEYLQQRVVRVSTEKVALGVAAVPHPGLQGELVALVGQTMNSKSGVVQVA